MCSVMWRELCHECEAVRGCRGSDEYSWSAASVEQMECYSNALTVGHFTRGLPRRLLEHSGVWPTQMGVHVAVGWCTVLYVGRFCKDWSAAAVHSGHLLYVSLHFMWLRTLTEHWNKYYLCLQARSNYLQNHSKTMSLSSHVSRTSLVYTYLVRVSASWHPALHMSCSQKLQNNTEAGVSEA